MCDVSFLVPEVSDNDNNIGSASASDTAKVRAGAERLIGAQLAPGARVTDWRIWFGRDPWFLFRLETSESDWQALVDSQSTWAKGGEPSMLYTTLVPEWGKHGPDAPSVGGFCWRRFETDALSKDTQLMFCWVISDGSESPYAVACWFEERHGQTLPSVLYQLDGP
ncbi:MAG: hypothetical protein HRU11_15125 [Parvularculaceae bacterium]|nr:hypothetical protein [Parvularculaceae bacterium]